MADYPHLANLVWFPVQPRGDIFPTSTPLPPFRKPYWSYLVRCLVTPLEAGAGVIEGTEDLRITGSFRPLYDVRVSLEHWRVISRLIEQERVRLAMANIDQLDSKLDRGSTDAGDWPEIGNFGGNIPASQQVTGDRSAVDYPLQPDVILPRQVRIYDPDSYIIGKTLYQGPRFLRTFTLNPTQAALFTRSVLPFQVIDYNVNPLVGLGVDNVGSEPTIQTIKRWPTHLQLVIENNLPRIGDTVNPIGGVVRMPGDGNGNGNGGGDGGSPSPSLSPAASFTRTVPGRTGNSFDGFTDGSVTISTTVAENDVVRLVRRCVQRSGVTFVDRVNSATYGGTAQQRIPTGNGITAGFYLIVTPSSIIIRNTNSVAGEAIVTVNTAHTQGTCPNQLP